MHQIDIAREIGRLETGLSVGLQEAHRRMDDMRRELMGHIAMLHKRNGNTRKAPWLQLAAMGTVALSSLLGLLKPEAAAAILRALIH